MWSVSPGAAVLLVICVVVVALLLATLATLATRALGAHKTGGAPPRASRPARSSAHLVVDTLNLTHWVCGKGSIGLADIIGAIDATAPALKARHPGEIVYVVKDRESEHSTPEVKSAYADAAKRNRVSILLALRYSDPPRGVAPSDEHSALGRDDFTMAVLAAQLKCAVLTGDALRDFGRFRATLQPFHTLRYRWWADAPQRDFIRPEASGYARLKKPRTVAYTEYGIRRAA